MSVKIKHLGKKLRNFVPLSEVMNIVPPWKCRAMAVVPNEQTGETERIPMKELLEVSGLPRRTFQALSYRQDWAGVHSDVASRFLYACCVDILRKDPYAKFIKTSFKSGFPYFHKKQRDALDRAARKMK